MRTCLDAFVLGNALLSSLIGLVPTVDARHALSKLPSLQELALGGSHGPQISSISQEGEHSTQEQFADGRHTTAHRSLKQQVESEVANVTVVSTPEQLMSALVAGAPHVVVQAHLDLTTIEPRGEMLMLSSDDILQDLPQSIRGNCTTEKVSTATLSGLTVPSEGTLKPGQCAIMTDMRLMDVLQNLWLNNLYIRHHRTNRTDSVVVLWCGTLQCNLWLTDVSLEGDAEFDPEFGGLGVEGGQAYAEGLLITNFMSDRSALQINNGATVSLNNCTLTRNIISDLHTNSAVISINALNPNELASQPQDTVLLMQQCALPDNSAPHDIAALKGSDYYTLFDAEVYSDVEREVHRSEGFASGSQPLAQAPATRPGINSSSAWFLDVVQSLGLDPEDVSAQPQLPATNASAPVPAPGNSALPGTSASNNNSVSDAFPGVDLTVSVGNQEQQSAVEGSDGKGGNNGGSRKLLEPILGGVGALILLCIAVAGIVYACRVKRRAAGKDAAAKAAKGAQASELQDVATSKSTSSYKRAIQVTDTFDLTRTAAFVLPPPGQNASSEERADFLQQQLDGFGLHVPIFDDLLLLGSGSKERRLGGQAVVQMAISKASRVEYAIKLFLSSAAFHEENELYSRNHDGQGGGLAQFLPKVLKVDANESGQLKDSQGHPLPPLIVMERGESLDVWAARRHPDRPMAYAMIHQLADRISELHALGYVHRDLKPGNVMWLPRENRWTIIDFGCVARTGDTAKLAFSISYAAPEEAVDVWALGVMAFELLTSSPAFSLLQGQEVVQVMDRIEGRNGQHLPWEGDMTPAVRRQLGVFRDPVLQLLSREAAQRPAMQEFCMTCERVLAGATTVQS